MSDPLAAFIRAERDAVLEAAPPPHAARLWHEARRRRAASLRKAMSAAGWLVRLVVGATLLVSVATWRPDAYFLAFLCLLSIWLTRGACAPVQRETRKGIPQ